MEPKRQMIHHLPAPYRWWHVITHHVQGMHFVNENLVALSRNGRPTGEVLFAACVGGKWFWNTDQIESDESHVGGIDGYGDLLAVPSYDHSDPAGGFLSLYRMEDDCWAQTFRMRVMFRPYAVGITGIGDYHVLAAVACPRGSAVRWFSIHRMSHEVFAHGGVSHFTMGARNNIVLTGEDDAATFYEMRAGFRYDTVKKYRVDPTSSPGLCIDAVARAKNGLCGVRWGATLTGGGKRLGEEVLHTTARNAFSGRLCTTAQKLRWKLARV